MHKRLKNIRIAFILLLIFSVGISSLHLIETDSTQKAPKEVAGKKNSTEKQEEISNPAELEAVVPFFAFEIMKDFYLISKLNFQDDSQEEVYTREPLYTSNYFKTLFCFVISPNAP